MTTVLICVVCSAATGIAGFFIGKDNANKAHFNDKVDELKNHIESTTNASDIAMKAALTKITTSVQNTSDNILNAIGKK